MHRKLALLLMPLMAAIALAYMSAQRGELTKKWGYIDQRGRTAIKAQFDEARSFSEGLAAVRIGDNRVIMGEGAARPVT